MKESDPCCGPPSPSPTCTTAPPAAPSADGSCDAASIPPACCTLDIAGADQERLVGLFKALGHPIRFEILKFLLTHPGCITGKLVDHLPIAQSTVSQHLKVLRDAGWIRGEVQGPATCYCMDPETLSWFRRTVGRIL